MEQESGTAAPQQVWGIDMGSGAGAKYLWFDGEIIPWEKAMVHVTHIEVAVPTHIFEGIRAYWSDEAQQLNIFCLEAHMSRFAQGLKLMRMQPRVPITDVGQGIVDLIRANGDRTNTYIRPFAFKNEPGPVMSSPRLDTPATIVIYTAPFVPKLDGEEVVSACVSSWRRISDNVMPTRVKAGANYRNSQLASAEAQLNGYDLPIFLNSREKVCESSGSCLMIVRDGTVVTPPVTADILESVTRSVLIQLCREGLGVPVVEREMDRTELYVADEAFFCATGAEVMPIGSIDRLTVGDGQVGPITRKLRALYKAVLLGTAPGYTQWLTPIWD
jgi:branched-chain amino acid aminotransferase